MYEVDVEGDVVTVSAEAFMDAWAVSSPQAVADALALEVDTTTVVCAEPRVRVRRIR